MADQLSEAFKALGNPHRLRIVRLLLEEEWTCCEEDRPGDCRLDPASCNVGELAERLEVSASTTSHHLKELERAGVIERARKGRRLFCRVNTDTLQRLREVLEPARRPTTAGSEVE